ncbi:GlpM family protein [Snodgrassella sp. CFCC 13594]|uniref:GlpM family protein n=1 Tax=Snodgrassella sp. CFCC 13594 TaxID=1775559 RepID=UPI00082D65B8|nr:GlpM family protein [Snodgrassella sp. CFCC 13594]
MGSLIIKGAIGAMVVLLIAVLSKSKSFYIAGLVPLFPTFALIAHVIVYQAQGTTGLRQTALFGLWSMIPYAVYLLLVYVLAERWPLWLVLGMATVAWVVAAMVLILGWRNLH